MTTIRLNINEKVLDKVLWLLSNFKVEDVQIIEEDLNFLKQKKNVEDILKRIEQDQEKFYSREELNSQIDKLLSKYDR